MAAMSWLLPLNPPFPALLDFRKFYVVLCAKVYLSLCDLFSTSELIALSMANVQVVLILQFHQFRCLKLGHAILPSVFSVFQLKGVIFTQIFTSPPICAKNCCEVAPLSAAVLISESQGSIIRYPLCLRVITSSLTLLLRTPFIITILTVSIGLVWLSSLNLFIKKIKLCILKK